MWIPIWDDIVFLPQPTQWIQWSHALQLPSYRIQYYDEASILQQLDQIQYYDEASILQQVDQMQQYDETSILQQIDQIQQYDEASIIYRSNTTVRPQ